MATLDLLTGGRTVLGVGLGYRELEFEILGQPRGHRAKAFEEAVKVIKALWTQDEVELPGPYFPIPKVRVTTRPMQRPRPPIWMAANNDAGVRRAARLADGWLVNNHSTLAILIRQIELYGEELERHGLPFPRELPIIKELYVASSRERALREAGPYIASKYLSFREWGRTA